MRDLIKSLLFNRNLSKRFSVSCCVYNAILPEVITRTPSEDIRKILFLPDADNNHRTQLNQDVFALLVNRFKPGYFVEIGANDGFTLSNTYYLETRFAWRGVLIEANPKYKDILLKRGGAIVVNKGVSASKGTQEFVDAGLFGGLRDDLDDTHEQKTNGQPSLIVECASLQEILAECQAPSRIDFISIDIEGGERSIVQQMVGLPYRFSCGCIEHNHRRSDYEAMVRMLVSANYEIVWEGQTAHDLFFIDRSHNP